LKKGLLALALGTFGLGISEFVMMGILPYIASDFHVSISEAGHLISAYALGVCVGAPVVALFARKWKLRNILYLLMGIYSLSAALMALCPTSETGSQWQFVIAMLFRFLQGTPHGAFFGVGSIVADRLSKEGKSAFAVAIMCSGMTFANLIGNPLCTFITSVMSWRYVFCFTSLWGLLTLLCISKWIPSIPALPDHGIKGEFRFMKHLAPWLLFGCTMFGNSGIFCWYSYISPTMTQLAGVPENMMTLIMILAGVGMVLGNFMGGKLSDKYGPGHTGRGILILMVISLLLTHFTAHKIWCSILLMMLNVGFLFAVSSPQQLLFVRHSKGGELMGGAMVQIAFNFGNAVGAWAGGLPIDETNPQSYHLPALIGACVVVFGVICYILFCRRYERNS
jgi:DHA1 family arabinose polymer transporter-like MFS transporter